MMYTLCFINNFNITYILSTKKDTMYNNLTTSLNIKNKQNNQSQPTKRPDKEKMLENILKLDQPSLIQLVIILIEYRSSRVGDSDNLDIKNQLLTLLENLNIQTNNKI